MTVNIKLSRTLQPADAQDRQLRFVRDLQSSVRALLDALKDQHADEIEQQVLALDSQCAAISARRHHERAQLSLPASSADTTDALLNTVAEVRGALQVARLFLAKLRRTNAVMSQVHAVAAGAYSMREPGLYSRQ